MVLDSNSSDFYSDPTIENKKYYQNPFEAIIEGFHRLLPKSSYCDWFDERCKTGRWHKGVGRRSTKYMNCFQEE